jgi:hypothetical protein
LRSWICPIFCGYMMSHYVKPVVGLQQYREAFRV